MHGMTAHIPDDGQVSVSSLFVNVIVRPVRSAIIQAMTAPGGAPVIGNQASGHQPVDGKGRRVFEIMKKRLNHQIFWRDYLQTIKSLFLLKKEFFP